MKKSLMIAMAVAGLTASQVAYSAIWNQVDHDGDVINESIDIISVGQNNARTQANTGEESMSLYPFVGKQGEHLYVGVKTDDPDQILPGSLQMQIDNKPTWTISQDEAPDDLIAPAADDDDPKAVSNNDQRSYIVATGNKARQIINQMKHGKQVKFRIRTEEEAMPAGYIPLDYSFKQALTNLGVSQAMLSARGK